MPDRIEYINITRAAARPNPIFSKALASRQFPAMDAIAATDCFRGSLSRGWHRCDSATYPGPPGNDESSIAEEVIGVDPRKGNFIVHGFGAEGDKVVKQLAEDGLSDVAYLSSPAICLNTILTAPNITLLAEPPDLYIYIIAAADLGDWLGVMTGIVDTCALNFLMIIDTEAPFTEFKRKFQYLTDIFDMTMPLPFPSGIDLYESASWAVSGALDLLVTPGIVCRDYVDVRIATHRSGFGVCIYTNHFATQQRADRAMEDIAAQLAGLSNQLNRPKGALLSIFAGLDMDIGEFDRICGLSLEPFLGDLKLLVVGVCIHEHLQGWLAVSLVLNGV